ncbi:MAG TPA: chaperone modulator CbpM [Lentimicrobium sp.]|jgi:hypothetical protein|nr:chaperone modulator CbpM [Bacteroidales bacterium]HLO92293.1 chaperone modulator CbpM [Lentimicrobium sp.]
MKNDELVSVIEFCKNHQAELSFVSSLKESGLIDFVFIEGQAYININHLRQLETMISFHYDLEINLEGIETIIELLNRINDLQHRLAYLQEKLKLLEE